MKSKLTSQNIVSFIVGFLFAVGLALSGGGMEGFLYQIGVLHALNAALTDRTMNQIDMISTSWIPAECEIALMAPRIGRGHRTGTVH